MPVETVRNHLIVIASMGFSMFSIGLVLYTKLAWVSPYIRYLLPLPPIAVAAYIYVLDVIKEDGNRTLNIAHDLLMQTFVGSMSFVLIVFMLLTQHHVISVIMKK